MNPQRMLLLLVAMTVIASFAQGISVHRRRCMLKRLAKQWKMHFAPGDQLRLADRIAGKLPILGAANVAVFDMLFLTDEADHCYIFTVEFGVGVVRGKRRRCRVGGFREAIARGPGACQECKLILAPQEMCLKDAYEYVHRALTTGVVQGSGV